MHLIAISTGNTRTHLGLLRDEAVEDPRTISNDDLPAIIDVVTGWWRSLHGSTDAEPSARRAAIVLASVNESVSGSIASAIRDQLGTEVYVIGEDLPVPIGRSLDPETITGDDRLLNAAAAFDRVKQACIVIDAGTAVTVDFVDGEGTFHGGAIAPGAAMQLRALHDHTAALPEIALRAPDEETFGRSTGEAMLNGVVHGIRGMVQRLIERYSERYGAFPLVIATGGDAALLFEHEAIVNRIVPELTLVGIGVAARHALESGADGKRDERPGHRGS